MRVGNGYDVHRLVEGRRLILGGVDIPFEKGLLGHSDADVALHAVIDSILGAAGMGDIGGMFPDTSAEFKDADSLILLKTAVDSVANKGYKIGNIDVIITAQQPKLKPYINEMKVKIADACGISEEDVNVKATTEEGLGFTGKGEGISSYSTVLLYK
ncbi:MAG: 2-C-methyl-D-erythritol 2,4-cyclodiphosphate synthase [Oscillospiraceae bacterium]|nr:2-C-methyl-D-erythritol 2,4-cyclodiphosphate synthase [Oscillospiraceae bacterium]